MTEHLIVTDAEGIRTIRMNRPDKKNALTLATYETMTAALEGANADDSVRCVLIAGVPGAFSAGNDLVDFLKAAESRDGLNRPALRFLPRGRHQGSSSGAGKHHRLGRWPASGDAARRSVRVAPAGQ